MYKVRKHEDCVSCHALRFNRSIGSSCGMSFRNFGRSWWDVRVALSGFWMKAKRTTQQTLRAHDAWQCSAPPRRVYLLAQRATTRSALEQSAYTDHARYRAIICRRLVANELLQSAYKKPDTSFPAEMQ